MNTYIYIYSTHLQEACTHTPRRKESSSNMGGWSHGEQLSTTVAKGNKHFKNMWDFGYLPLLSSHACRTVFWWFVFMTMEYVSSAGNWYDFPQHEYSFLQLKKKSVLLCLKQRYTEGYKQVSSISVKIKWSWKKGAIRGKQIHLVSLKGQ